MLALRLSLRHFPSKVLAVLPIINAIESLLYYVRKGFLIELIPIFFTIIVCVIIILLKGLVNTASAVWAVRRGGHLT